MAIFLKKENLFGKLVFSFLAHYILNIEKITQYETGRQKADFMSLKTSSAQRTHHNPQFFFNQKISY